MIDVHGVLSVWHGARCFGRYDAQGRPFTAERPKNARAHLPQDRRSSAPPPRSIPRLKRRPGPRLPTGPRTSADRSRVKIPRTFHLSATVCCMQSRPVLPLHRQIAQPRTPKAASVAPRVEPHRPVRVPDRRSSKDAATCPRFTSGCHDPRGPRRVT